MWFSWGGEGGFELKKIKKNVRRCLWAYPNQAKEQFINDKHSGTVNSQKRAL